MPRSKRGISEKIVYAFNPLPPCDEADLLEIAGLEHTRASERQPFALLWKYSAGLERETLRLPPGERRALRASEGQEFLAEFREEGGVLLSEDADEAEITSKAIEGMEAAIRFYKDRGHKRVIEYRKVHGLGAAELEDYKYDLWAYYLNEAKATFLSEKVNEIKKPKKSKAKKED